MMRAVVVVPVVAATGTVESLIEASATRTASFGKTDA